MPLSYEWMRHAGWSDWKKHWAPFRIKQQGNGESYISRGYLN